MFSSFTVNDVKRCLVILWLSMWYLVAIIGGFYYIFQDSIRNTLAASSQTAEGAAKAPVPKEKEAKSDRPAILSVDLDIAVAMVLLLGGIGANVTATRQFVDKETDPQKWYRPPTWYWFAPFDGMFIAAFIFLALRAGVLGLAQSENDQVANPNFYFFIAAVCGMFTNRFYGLLDDLAQKQLDHVRTTETKDTTKIIAETKTTVTETGKES